MTRFRLTLDFILDPHLAAVLCRLISKYALLVIGLTLAVTIIFIQLLPGVRFENIPGKLDLPPHDPLRRDLDEFQSKFGSGEIIIIGTELRHPPERPHR